MRNRCFNARHKGHWMASLPVSFYRPFSSYYCDSDFNWIKGLNSLLRFSISLPPLPEGPCAFSLDSPPIGADNEVSQPEQASLFNYHLFSGMTTTAPGMGGDHCFMPSCININIQYVYISAGKQSVSHAHYNQSLSELENWKIVSISLRLCESVHASIPVHFWEERKLNKETRCLGIKVVTQLPICEASAADIQTQYNNVTLLPSSAMV